MSESLLVVGLGVFAALAANFISPRGLSLTRDYFPAKGSVGPAVGPGPAADRALQSTATNAVTTPVSGTVPDQTGMETLTTAQVLELFRDPQYEHELIVFVDARANRSFEEGHIPGAYQLDRYYPENHLPTVLPACLNATRVVVYCTGGECEDSHFAAQLLQEAGVPADVLSVYTGGITEWEAQQLPVETGVRKSGNLRERKR